MPVCSKCHPTYDLGRICPHEGPGRRVWDEGRAAGRVEVAGVLTDLIAELRHRHTPYRVCMECDDWYAGCEDHEHITVCLWCCTSHGYHSMDCADNHTGTTLAEHCVTVGMADRAEARLREVSGDE